jgi:VWFA-related protein
MLAGGRSAGQQAASPQGAGPQSTFRARVDSVTVDAIVTDKQGKPVTDLTADDFEITENKKPQAVQAFKLIKIDGSRDSEFTHDILSLDDQQRETAREDVRVMVIFMDDYHVRRGNGMQVREQIANFVQQLTPHDLVAIMYPLTPVSALTFSRNHDGTASAIRAFDGRKYDYQPKNAYEERYADYPPEVLEELRRQITTSALESAATYLGTLKDGKKLILFVSEGLVGTLPPGVQTTGTSVLTRPGTGAASQTQQDRAAFMNQVDVLNEMKQVFSAAARSNTSIYTLDPRGLATSEFQINDNVSSENDRRTLAESQDSLRVLAGNTDGRAIVNRNEPASELHRMVEDLSAYYLLGYTSTESPRDGKFHEIQVRVKRKDLEVRARKGYWAMSADDVAKVNAAPREGPPPAVEAALGTLAPVSRDRAVQVWTGSERGADGMAKVTLAWEATADPNMQAAERVAAADVVDHITLSALSIQGDVLFRGTVPKDPQTLRPAGRISFGAPPGGVRFQIVAENASGLRLDHQDETLEIPDYTQVGPLVTTPVVFRGRTARDLQQIRAATAPLPSVSRSFSRTDRLLVRFQAYGPGNTTPVIALRLLNSQGKSMADLPAPTRLADGTFEAEIGLGPLAPSDYLIEISATTGNDKITTLVAIHITS